MSRIRSIKPEVNDDEAVASLSSDAWRLWVSMWTLADDEGNLRASVRQLKAKVFWAYEPAVSVETMLSELQAVNRIDLYVVRGEQFAHVKNWKRHQKIDKPQPGKVPGIEEARQSSVPTARDSGVVRERRGWERAGTEDERTRGYAARRCRGADGPG